MASAPPNGTYYRFARRDASVDMELTDPNVDWRLPVDIRTSKAYKKYDQCGAFAYSMYTQVDSLIEIREVSSWARRKTILQIELVPADGRILHTPNDGDSHQDHHDWWPTPDAVPPRNRVIAEASE